MPKTHDFERQRELAEQFADAVAGEFDRLTALTTPIEQQPEQLLTQVDLDKELNQ